MTSALPLARLVVAVIAAATAVGVAACGGHATTRADVIARGNAICSTATRAIAAVPPATSGSPAALGRYLARVAKIVDRQVASRRALPRPATGRAGLERFVAAETRLADGYHRLAAVARSGDGGALQTALQQLQHSPAPALARHYGLTQCTGTTPTVR